MAYNQGQVVQWFAEGKTNKNASHLYSRDNALYSYGRHFPLAVRHSAETSLKHSEDWFLLNGDRYSNTTSRHQSMTFSVFNHQPRVSFNAIRAAGIDPFAEDLVLVDFTEDKYMRNYVTEDGQPHTYTRYSDEPNVSYEQFKALRRMGDTYSEEKHHVCTGKEHVPNAYTEVKYQSIHRIGGVLLQYRGECYLCAMDESSYFVSQLPAHVNSIECAFELLKPRLIKQADKDGIVYKRQGEWFFIPTELKDKKEFILAQGFALPRRENRGNIHQCAAGLPVTVDGEQAYLCRGMIRHQDSRGYATREHRILRLGNVVHIAVRNTEKASWSAGGRVD
jgi:hypothetical protein